MDSADLGRIILISATCVVGFLMINRLRKLFRVSSLAEKFLFTGILLTFVALGGRSYLALVGHEDWVWPLWFYMSALLCFLVYLTEPSTRYLLRYRGEKKE